MSEETIKTPLTLKDKVQKIIQRLGGVEIKFIESKPTQEFRLQFKYPNETIGTWFYLIKPIKKDQLKINTYFTLESRLKNVYQSYTRKERSKMLTSLHKVIYRNKLVPEFHLKQDPPYFFFTERIYLDDKNPPDPNRLNRYLLKLFSGINLCTIFLIENLSNEQYTPEDALDGRRGKWPPMFS
jgi:hypothetical protein